MELVKKYHPDKYQDNPLKNLAEEKLREVNDAYEEIKRMRRSGYGSSGSSGGTSGTSGYESQSSGGSSYAGGSSYGGSAEFARVRSLLNSNAVREARGVLEGMSNRNAEWNYLYGITLFRCGEYSAAKQYLELATELDPTNAEYRSAFNSTAAQGSRSYHDYGSSGSGNTLGTACSICSTLWCADSCCECCGGDLCRCC